MRGASLVLRQYLFMEPFLLLAMTALPPIQRDLISTYVPLFINHTQTCFYFVQQSYKSVTHR